MLLSTIYMYTYAYYIYTNQTMQTCIFLSALLFCTYCKSNVLTAKSSVSCGPPLGWESSSNFAELQKGCKIVLGGRAAPYLRVVTNDKYCTSCPTSYQEPDQRLYSTTARVCLSLTQIVGLFIYSELLACSKGPNYSNLRI